MSLQKYCRRPVVKISPSHTIAAACRMMEENNVGCLLAELDGKLCGIITDRDVALKVSGAAKDPLTTKVEEIMTRDPIRISVDKDLHHLTSLMQAYHVRRVPIVDNFETAIGIISVDDLIALLGDEMSQIGKAIAEEISGGTA